MTTNNRAETRNAIRIIVAQAVELDRDLTNSEFNELARRLRLIRGSVEDALRLVDACKQE